MRNFDPPYHCVKSVGNMEPSKTVPVCEEDPVQIPIGPMLNKGHELPKDMHFNEYHIYDVGQVRMKYLVELMLN